MTIALTRDEAFAPTRVQLHMHFANRRLSSSCTREYYRENLQFRKRKICDWLFLFLAALFAVLVSVYRATWGRTILEKTHHNCYAAIVFKVESRKLLKMAVGIYFIFKRCTHTSVAGFFCCWYLLSTKKISANKFNTSCHFEWTFYGDLFVRDCKYLWDIRILI